MKKYYHYTYSIEDKYSEILGNGVIEEDDGLFRMFDSIKFYAEKNNVDESQIIISFPYEILEEQFKYLYTYISKEKER